MSDGTTVTEKSRFTAVWRTWLQLGAPVENSRVRRHRAVTYSLEVTLDHVDSSVHAIAGAAMAGAAGQWAQTVRDELRELDGAARELDRLNLDAAHRKPFDDYIATTRALLLATEELLLSKSAG